MREQVRGIELSSDGKHAVFLSPETGRVTHVVTIDTQTQALKVVARGDSGNADVTHLSAPPGVQ